MKAGVPSVRPLTLATFGPALLTVLALPFGFINEGIAVVAGVYGLYFAVPAVVAWCLDVFRGRLPRWAQRTLGVLILLVAVPAIAFWLLWTGPLFTFALPPAAVVLIVAFRLMRARSPTRG
jgi:hypothetical protein